jgi:hypothetical protein
MAESRMLNLIFFTNVESYFLIMSNLVFINIEIVVECFCQHTVLGPALWALGSLAQALWPMRRPLIGAV